MANSWQDSLRDFLDANPDLPEGETAEPESKPAPSVKPRLDIVLDRKGRAGKSATIVAGFADDDPEITRVAGVLKTRLATGGSTRGGEILIQGDKRQAVKDILASLGYKSRII